MGILSEIAAELSRLGVISDIAGAILIARGVFWRSNRSILQQSGAALGYNHLETVGGITSKREAIMGTILLGGGFVLQYFGSIHGDNTPNYAVNTLFGVLCGIVVILSILFISIWTNQTVKRLVDEKASRQS